MDDDSSEILEGPASGHLCLSSPWPGQARTVYGDHQRFVETYFSQYPGYYFTGDGCTRDEQNFFTITGRVDDVLNVSGHRIGTAEIESVLVETNWVAEVAIVGVPHSLKGQGVCAFVVAQNPDTPPSQAQLNGSLRDAIGAHAKLDALHIVAALPKTRSGKCMRRILRCLAVDADSELGDVSTLADPSVVESIRTSVSSI